MNTPMIYSLDAGELLHRVAETLPAHVTGNVVIIGSIAAAWAFRDEAMPGRSPEPRWQQRFQKPSSIWQKARAMPLPRRAHQPS